MQGPRIWFDRPGVHWGRALLVAALATCGVALWLAASRGLWGTPEVALDAPATPASVPSSTRVAAPSQAVRPADAAPPSAPAPVRAEAGNGDVSELRVCGLGSVSAGPQGGDAAARRLRAQRARPVLARWLEALQASPEPRGRAAALVLAPMLGEPRPLPVSVWAAQRERLAELAGGGPRDAGVLALALQACAIGAAPAEGSACARLTAEDAIAADPAHGEPWWLLAERERSAADPQLAEEAIRRALGLPFGRVAEQSLYGAVQAAQPADAGVIERLEMYELLAALRGAWSDAAVQATTSWCAAAALAAQPARRDACQQLAEHLVLRGVTLAQVGAGRSLGERLGWFPERMAAAGRDLDAAARLEASFRGDDAHDCPALQRQLDHQLLLASQGEAAAVRRSAAAPPRP